jgi:hypothetical protein
MYKNRFINFRSQIVNRKGPEDLIRVYTIFFCRVRTCRDTPENVFRHTRN